MICLRIARLAIELLFEFCLLGHGTSMKSKLVPQFYLLGEKRTAIVGCVA